MAISTTASSPKGKRGKGDFRTQISNEKGKHGEIKTIPEHKLKNLKKDTRAWIFSLVGAGIGAGILFLPIKTGQAGFLLTVIGLLISYPIVYFAQKYLMSLVLFAVKAESINDAIEQYTGKIAALIFSFIYAVMTYVMVSAYAIGINTTMQKFLIKLNIIPGNLTGIEYGIYAFIILSILTVIGIIGDRFLIKLLGYLTVLLIICIALTSILFIPQWDLSRLININLSPHNLLANLLVIIPIFVFAITVIQPLSPMVCFFKENHSFLSVRQLEATTTGTYKKGFMLFVTLVAVFTLSVILSLNPETFVYAGKHNLSALVVIGKSINKGLYLTILEYLGIGISFFALLTSYYGIGFGFTETIAGNMKFLKISFRQKRVLATIIFNILLWLFVVFNFNIINTIGIFIVPCMGIILFILPSAIIIFYKKFKFLRTPLTYFILLCGIFLIASFFVGISMQ